MYTQSNHSSTHPHEYTPPMQPIRGRQGQHPARCANCDIDILWPAVVVQGKTYCCTGCAAGGPCNCDYSLYRSVNVSGVIHYGIESERESEQ